MPFIILTTSGEFLHSTLSNNEITTTNKFTLLASRSAITSRELFRKGYRVVEVDLVIKETAHPEIK